MNYETSIKPTQNDHFWKWLLIGAVLWLSIASIYYYFDMDWLARTDSGWYWKVVNDLGAFDPAIQPLYPLVVRGLITIFPNLQPTISGQIISLICYSLALPFMFKIFQLLKTKKPHTMTLLWALFPFVGLTMAVYPRANAMLLLFTVLCFWSYLKGDKTLFLITASLLPLIHRSSLFFLVFLIPLAVFEKRIKWWMASLTPIPMLLYLFLGITKHNSIFWWFVSYKGVKPVTSLPLGDGIVGSFLLGMAGNTADLIKGFIVLFVFGLSIYMLVSRIWKEYPFLLAAILPIIVLGLILPAREIWSLMNYSSFFIIPLSIISQPAVEKLDRRNYQWVFPLIVGLFYMSQWIWAIFELHYFDLI